MASGRSQRQAATRRRRRGRGCPLGWPGGLSATRAGRDGAHQQYGEYGNCRAAAHGPIVRRRVPSGQAPRSRSGPRCPPSRAGRTRFPTSQVGGAPQAITYCTRVLMDALLPGRPGGPAPAAGCPRRGAAGPRWWPAPRVGRAFGPPSSSATSSRRSASSRSRLAARAGQYRPAAQAAAGVVNPAHGDLAVRLSCHWSRAQLGTAVSPRRQPTEPGWAGGALVIACCRYLCVPLAGAAGGSGR